MRILLKRRKMFALLTIDAIMNHFYDKKNLSSGLGQRKIENHRSKNESKEEWEVRGLSWKKKECEPVSDGMHLVVKLLNSLPWGLVLKKTTKQQNNNQTTQVIRNIFLQPETSPSMSDLWIVDLLESLKSTKFGGEPW